MYFSSKHGAGLKNTLSAIRNRESFKSGGALSGSTTERAVGRLPEVEADIFYADANNIDYVVFSYGTPIAWHVSGGEFTGWTVPEVKYSATTTSHQSVARRAINSDY